MSIPTIYYNNSTIIHNDYKALDKFNLKLSEIRNLLIQTTKCMNSSITELNDKGFADGQFEQLFKVFSESLQNINNLENKFIQFESHINGLSNKIKNYYNVEI